MKFKRARKLYLTMLALNLAWSAGCSSKSSEEVAIIPIVLGNMLEPFEPPPLEELIAAHEWVDRAPVDFMQRLRDWQQEQGPPPVKVEEALAVRNDGEEANEKILTTLGRMAPPDGSIFSFASSPSLRPQQNLSRC